MDKWIRSEEDGQVFWTGPEELGEANVIEEEDENTFTIPGASEDFSGPFDSLESAVAAANNYI